MFYEDIKPVFIYDSDSSGWFSFPRFNRPLDLEGVDKVEALSWSFYAALYS